MDLTETNGYPPTTRSWLASRFPLEQRRRSQAFDSSRRPAFRLAIRAEQRMDVAPDSNPSRTASQNSQGTHRECLAALPRQFGFYLQYGNRFWPFLGSRDRGRRLGAEHPRSQCFAAHHRFGLRPKLAPPKLVLALLRCAPMGGALGGHATRRQAPIISSVRRILRRLPRRTPRRVAPSE